MSQPAWYRTKFQGIVFREHDTRTHRGKPDRYYVMRYTLKGKTKQEALGWASEGWTPEKANVERGKRRRGQKRGATAGASQRLEQTVQQDEVLNVAQTHDEPATGTFAFIASQYLEIARIEKLSWRDDSNRLKKHVLSVIGALPIENVTVRDIEKLKAACYGKGLAPATTVRVLALTKTVFNYAIRHGMTKGENPVKGVRLPKVNNARTRFLSRDEAQTLLREAHKQNVTLHDTCLMALYTGMRSGEVLRLRWSDIDFEHAVITIRETKNGSTRFAYLTDNVRTMLEARREAQRVGKGGTIHERSVYSENGLVFPSARGSVRDSMSHQFKHLVKRLGWNEGVDDRRHLVTFHTLRHTFASWLVSDGTPLLLTKELMGHKCIEMTMRYSHLAPSQARAAVERLALNGAQGGSAAEA